LVACGRAARLRPSLLILGVAVAVAFFFAGAIFGLNGTQWRWWQYASWAASASVFVGSLAVVRVPLCQPEEITFASLSRAAPGAVLSAVSLIVMAEKYSDPYGGNLLWPHLLAALGLCGVLLAEAGLYLGLRPLASSDAAVAK
jgi:hypothetical protein